MAKGRPRPERKTSRPDGSADAPSTRDRLRKPLTGTESPAQRRERLRKIREEGN